MVFVDFRRFHRERERERDRPRSREPRDGPGYNNYYSDSPAHDYGFRERARDLPPPPRERTGGPRYPPRNHPSQHNIPPLLPHLVPGGGGAHQPPPLMSLGPPPPDRKDYYDSYNRYFRYNSTLICVPFTNRLLIEQSASYPFSVLEGANEKFFNVLYVVICFYYTAILQYGRAVYDSYVLIMFVCNLRTISRMHTGTYDISSLLV